MVVLLQVIGIFAALFASAFWFKSASFKDTDLDFMGQWNDDSTRAANFFGKVSRYNKYAAFSSGVSAMAFGLQALTSMFGGQ